MRVYTSQYSTIDIHKEAHFLVGNWLKESANLKEEGVKKEISKILDYVRIYKIQKAMVDVRNYPFRENENIQRWINNTYIPLIIDQGVQQYAIIVEEMIVSKFDHLEDFYDEADAMKMKYFTDPKAALEWLK